MVPRKTLLCIDDEPIGLLVRKLILEFAGYRVLTARNGREGLRLFTSGGVDAVIVDYYMPGMDGGRVAARMRQINPRIPILLLSAYVDLPHEALHLADVYLIKGEPPAVLLEELKTLLQRRRGDDSEVAAA